jgi:hypothetical protein
MEQKNTSNTSLLAEKLKTELLRLQNTVKHLKNIQKHLPEEIKNEKNEYKKSKLELELLETGSRIEVLEQIVENRKKHYEKDFLPNHNKLLKECNENFDKYFKRVKEFAEDIRYKTAVLTMAYLEYLKVNPNNEDEELKVGFYQEIKKIIDNIDKGKYKRK